MNEEDQRQLAQTFDLYDADGTGHLDADELSELLASLGDVKFSAVSRLSFEVATFVEVEHRAPPPCGMSATACGDGTCIAANELCDGSISCLSAEDEANCGSIDNSGGIGGLAPPPAPPLGRPHNATRMTPPPTPHGAR